MTPLEGPKPRHFFVMTASDNTLPNQVFFTIATATLEFFPPVYIRPHTIQVTMPIEPRTRRGIERTPTGDDSDPFFAMCAKNDGTPSAQAPRKPPARRGVRRKPTGDADLELMAAIDAEMDEEQKPKK